MTVPQTDGALEVIRKRAKERNTSKLLEISYSDIDSLEAETSLGINGRHQYTNAALAVALCKEWIACRQKDGVEFEMAPDFVKSGLKTAFWPGRCQKIQSDRYPGFVWFVDGAHTAESMKACADWFESELKVNISSPSLDDIPPVYLIFNCTHGRDAYRLLPDLVRIFKMLPNSKAVFCTNTMVSPTRDEPDAPSTSDSATSDLQNNMVMPDPELNAQRHSAKVWCELAVEPNAEHRADIAASIMDAVEIIKKDATNKSGQHDVKNILVTGSLHLVGAVLEFIKNPIS